MDNLTHTLVGLVAGQAAVHLESRRAPARAERLRPVYWTCSAIANNLPDLDFLYARALSGRLGYLLHHRGHTHTLALAIVQGALVFLAFLGWNRWRGKQRFSKTETYLLFALSLAGPLIHLGLDFLNSYGVHPFWPYDSSWYYGDSVFILEPWLWVTLLPLMIFEARATLTKAIFSVFFALVLGLCFFTGYVPWQLTIIIALWGMWLLGLMAKTRPETRTITTTALCAALILLFAAAGRIAKIELRSVISRQFQESTVHDLVVSPLPANPLCWSIHTVETSAGTYVTRRGTLALIPWMLGAAECPELFRQTGEPVPAPPRPEIIWSGQFHAPLSELRELRRKYCAFDAFLRFARVPAWSRTPEGLLEVRDLRFERDGRRGFAHLLLDQNCMSDVPSWIPPRADILTL